MSEEVNSKGVEDFSKKVYNPDDAAELIGRMERIMKSNKSNVLTLACHKGIIFKKYKEDNKFMSANTDFKISKAPLTLRQVSSKLLMITLKCENCLFLFTF